MKAPPNHDSGLHFIFHWEDNSEQGLWSRHFTLVYFLIILIKYVFCANCPIKHLGLTQKCIRPTEINFAFCVSEKLKRYERARKQNKTIRGNLINNFFVCFLVKSAKRYERADTKRRIYFGWPKFRLNNEFKNWTQCSHAKCSQTHFLVKLFGT